MVETVNPFETVYLASSILLIAGLMFLQLFNKSENSEGIEPEKQKETQKEEVQP